MGSWLLWALLFVFNFQRNCSNGIEPELPVPQAVKLYSDEKLQRISVTWEQGPFNHNLLEKLLFDIEVLRNEEVVHHVTIEAGPDQVHRWNWTSPIPLECSSHSFRVRTRLLNLTSQWSAIQTAEGRDFSPSESVQVCPQDRIVRAGSTMRFYCILGEGRGLTDVIYNHTAVPSSDYASIGGRSYVIVLRNLAETKSSGNDLLCHDDTNSRAGATVFVGYPPGDRALKCETDLLTVECQWELGRPTNLWGDRATYYSLSGRPCNEAKRKRNSRCTFEVPLDQGTRNWTLTAKNPLGGIVLTDRADLNHRVRLQAPLKVMSHAVHAGNASVQWSWVVEAYRTLSLLCQVQLRYNGLTDTRNYTGQGLSGLVLTDLLPHCDYSLQVRCGTLQNFWKWSEWSLAHSFRTKEARPDALDVWIQMLSSRSALIMWKPLSAHESHGEITRYEVTWISSIGRNTSKLPPTKHSFLLPDLVDRVATVTAFNSAGSSPPSSVGLPRLSDSAAAVSRISGSESGFNLTWPDSGTATCGYVVEWYPTYRHRSYTLEWVKVPAGHTWARIPPGSSKRFAPGVKYSLSIYSCGQLGAELLAKREGYVEEMAPDQPVQNLRVHQSGAEVQLSWDGVPEESQQGFLRGYSVSRSLSSGRATTENITDPDARGHTMRNLPLGFHKFIVWAYTSAGGSSGAECSIMVTSSSDGPIIMTLISLGSVACFLILSTIICYQKRKWMKEKLYPVIPKPKLSHNWPMLPMSVSPTLDVTPCPYSRVVVMSDLMGNSGKHLEEEKEGSLCLSNADYCSLPHLRHYQQGLAGTSRCVSLESPDTSPGTRPTGITYTVIQTPPAPTQDVQPCRKYRPQISADPPRGLPLLMDDDYQPFPAGQTNHPATGSLSESLDTPTSASSLTFLLGGAASVGRFPVEISNILPYTNYANPTYHLPGPAHM